MNFHFIAQKLINERQSQASRVTFLMDPAVYHDSSNYKRMYFFSRYTGTIYAHFSVFSNKHYSVFSNKHYSVFSNKHYVVLFAFFYVFRQ